MSLEPLRREAPIDGLLTFISEWVPDLSDQHRLAPEKIPPFVPQPLRRVYELTGNYPVPSEAQWRSPTWEPGLFGAQDQLLPPDQLTVAEGRFTFIHENQGVWMCETLADHEDPPVFCASGARHKRKGDEISACLSQFLTTFCLQELAFGARHLLHVDSVDARPRELLRSPASDLWLEGVYAWRGASHSFYVGEASALIMSVDGDLWVAFNNEACQPLVREDVEVSVIR